MPDTRGLAVFVPANRDELRAADHGCLARDVRQSARELSISLAKKTLGEWQEPGVFLQLSGVIF
jgi:hypothetical protein